MIVILSIIFTLGCIFLFQNLVEYKYNKYHVEVNGKNRAVLPNVILFSSDGLDTERMSVYGNIRDTTPNIREFSKSAILFTRAYGNAQGFSRGGVASILTGKSPLTTKIYNTETILTGRHSFEHLPAIFKKLGYYCADFCDGVVLNPAIINMLEGFDEINGSKNYLYSNKLLNKLAKIYPLEIYFLRTLIINRVYKELVRMFGLRDVLFSVLSDKETIDLAIKTIKEVSKPKFIYIHLAGTHYLNFNKPKRIFFSKNKECTGLDDNDFYDDSLVYMDSLFKQIIDALIESGQYNQTIIAVITDHSRIITSNKNKFLMTRLPLIIKFSNINNSNNICDYPVQYLDIAPSILKAINVDIPDWIEGTPVLYPFHSIKEEWIRNRPIVSVPYNIDHVDMVKNNYYLQLVQSTTNFFHLENLKWISTNIYNNNNYRDCLLNLSEYLEEKKIMLDIKKKAFRFKRQFQKQDKYIRIQDITAKLIGKAKVSEITQGDLRVCFKEDKGEILYKNRMLTKGEGIHILLLFSGKWYSSVVDGIWDIDKINLNTMILKCKWLSLPISSTLEFKMIDANTINCKIETEIYKDIKLDQESFVVMLSDMYTHYFIPSKAKKEKFPKEHKNDFQWLDVWKDDIELTSQIELIDIANSDKIILGCSPILGQYGYLIISNTNERHQSRALIYNKTNKQKLSSGKYTFFEGKIEIFRSINNEN